MRKLLTCHDIWPRRSLDGLDKMGPRNRRVRRRTRGRLGLENKIKLSQMDAHLKAAA